MTGRAAKLVETLFVQFYPHSSIVSDLVYVAERIPWLHNSNCFSLRNRREDQGKGERRERDDGCTGWEEDGLAMNEGSALILRPMTSAVPGNSFILGLKIVNSSSCVSNFFSTSSFFSFPSSLSSPFSSSSSGMSLSLTTSSFSCPLYRHNVYQHYYTLHRIKVQPRLTVGVTVGTVLTLPVCLSSMKI